MKTIPIRFKKYLSSYHRPNAKIESLARFAFSVFTSQASPLSSERSFLFKFPPKQLLFYNSLGRCAYYTYNALFILCARRYAPGCNISIDMMEKPNISLQRLNMARTFHELDSKDEGQVDLQQLFEDYAKHLQAYELVEDDSDWWLKCRSEFANEFVRHPDRSARIRDFRKGSHSTSAALLNDSARLLGKRSKRANMLLSLRYIMSYHELARSVSTHTLLTNSESFIGNPKAINYRGIRINERTLRYSYYSDNINNNLPDICSKRRVIADIGGGYGGLIRALKHKLGSHTYVLCELPETLLFASYYLRCNFKGSSFKECTSVEDLESIYNSEHNYDFVLMTPGVFHRIKDDWIYLAINTTSIGEMTKETQQQYIKSIESTSQHFYSVNRLGSRSDDKYNTIGFSDLDFMRGWSPLLIRYTRTYHYEVLGRKVSSNARKKAEY